MSRLLRLHQDFAKLFMASFSADLYVSGQRFPVVQCTYGTDQATDSRGRVIAKVRYGPVQLVLDVPDSDMLLSWANMPQKQLYLSQSGLRLEEVEVEGE